MLFPQQPRCFHSNTDVPSVSSCLRKLCLKKLHVRCTRYGLHQVWGPVIHQAGGAPPHEGAESMHPTFVSSSEQGMMSVTELMGRDFPSGELR